jgi:Domain of unknown function (DUF4394)
VPRSTVLRRGAALAAVLALGSTAAADAQNRGDRGDRSSARTFYATTDSNLLLQFNDRKPDRIRDIQSITGLPSGVSLRGIDFRPLTGDLYGVGSDSIVYRVNPNTGIAVSEAPAFTPLLSGNSFGVDFNPTVDRLRIVSDTGQNLRANVDTGAASPPDGALSAQGVAGVGYTNNDADPNTATTLYDIDTAADQLSIQAPPNNGTLNPVGKLGVDTSNVVGFDIFSDLRRGTTDDVTAFASLTVGGYSGLYEINLFTGRASHRGNFSVGVTDIAIPLDR